MRVAIVHYHLQPGGVTRIIEHTAAALGSRASLVVLTGQAPEGDFPVPWRLVPGLAYEARRPDISAEALAREMSAAAADALDGTVDLIHVHNHALGKSTVLPPALALLARQGYRLLFHIHDFAEDGRPANYHLMLNRMAGSVRGDLARILYPLGGHTHYAVLNGRDYAFLRDIGTPVDNLHLLPNPVFFPDTAVTPEGRQRSPLLLYPTRAIRRKNLGEFLLWAVLLGRDFRFATTLGPENPRERPRYEAWQGFARQHGLAVEFEAALRPGRDFGSLVGEATALVTTSIAEGFGLAFLEPWLSSRPVCGRDLSEITSDFKKSGIRLDGLYQRLDIPVDWLGRGRLMDRIGAGLHQWLSAYGRRPAPEDPCRVEEAWIHEDRVDFGRLDEEMQMQVLEGVLRDPGRAALIRPPTLTWKAERAVLERNREILGREYSLEGYGRRLLSLYDRVAASRVTGLDSLDGERLLDHFLAPERLNLLRVD